jgi:formylmethanofuran dehydrogenase subunit C
MRGGLLRVRGRAGDWCGAALPGQAKGMTGGTILVDGNVGAEAGAGMRRGLLVIGGDSGESTGVRMLAGTIFCFGRLGREAALEMKRGSLVARSSGALLPGFRPAGEADPEWLRLYLAWLRRLDISCPQTWDRQPPKRFTGDHLVTGKGEVLIYEILE